MFHGVLRTLVMAGLGHDDLQIRRISNFLKHDLFRKPVATLGS